MASAGNPRQRQDDLVFDLGFHKGEDTGYYLAMGRRVVAVEANLQLVNCGSKRFAEAIANGRLVLLHAAVVGHRQRQDFPQLAFYPHPERSEWGSVDLRWVRRNAEAHHLPHSAPELVSTTCLEELVNQFGCPGFLKIDIEGADQAVLTDLRRLQFLPSTVSWETGKESLQSVLNQHRELFRIGYRKFRIVQQAFIECCPPALADDGTQWHFESGCSGEMPDKSNQQWHSIHFMRFQYCCLFLLYRLLGPRSLFRRASHSRFRLISFIPKYLIRLASSHRLPFPGWVDSHASLGEC